MTAMLEVDNVSRRFGGLMAVDSVTTTVAERELVGLIGPNGAGKTTLFNLISGFTPVSSGEIRYRGEKISGLKPSVIASKGISRTFQNLRVFPNMTVFDNVSVGAVGAIGQSPWQAIAGGAKGSKQISERSWEALEKVQLTQYANDLAANLAYGKRKYLEIARALAMNPDLLILDEPAAGLNDSETAELASFIKDLHSSGITVMLVEHDMGLVMSICERIVVLASGKKIADAEPSVVRQNREVLEAYLGVDE
ncbi:ABC transporter ATP-binding protein [Stappia sp. 28M-7]|uniref:ABC transporter ATP-binding protein n=1 Tax=Stappia sp. 28M-7 TaxID=2762596 RepID=UPI00163D1204|nr:ABC transporter ATP-binding protein [Stappia sp. 28M-7]MBC2858550.1 ABC transporter ATP-binding protein [Stappia sp. 28M-7]